MLTTSTLAASAKTDLAADRPIDLVHLARMTLGDRSLEREVLQLFTRQVGMLTERMRDGVPAVAAAAAHTLKGSARGVGAWPVAQAAEAVEMAVDKGGPELGQALTRLDAAASEATAVIADLLRSN